MNNTQNMRNIDCEEAGAPLTGTSECLYLTHCALSLTATHSCATNFFMKVGERPSLKGNIFPLFPPVQLAHTPC